MVYTVQVWRERGGCDGIVQVWKERGPESGGCDGTVKVYVCTYVWREKGGCDGTLKVSVRMCVCVCGVSGKV